MWRNQNYDFVHNFKALFMNIIGDGIYLFVCLVRCAINWINLKEKLKRMPPNTK